VCLILVDIYRRLRGTEVGQMGIWTSDELKKSDVVWFAPGEKHWHGATSTTAMTHIAIQEKLEGKVVDWMEHVTDEQYSKALR
jgi:hypothetical protein